MADFKCPVRHEENAEILLDYCARRLSSEAAEAIERHAASCPECARFVDGQRLAWKALDEWKAPPVSFDFDERLYARIEAERSNPWPVRLWHSNWIEALRDNWVRTVLPAAAVAGLALAAWLWQGPNFSFDTADPSSGQKIEMVDVEQVEKTLDDMEMLRQLNEQQQL